MMIGRRHATVAGFFVMLICSVAVAGPTVEQADDAVVVTFENGVTLDFATHEGLVLGLSAAEVDGVALTRESTVLRPVIAQEWDAGRKIYPFMKLKSAKADGERVLIEAELLGTTADQAYRDFFVYAGDRAKAKQAGLSPELQALKERRDTALASLVDAVAADENVKKQATRRAKEEERLRDAAANNDRGQVKRFESSLKRTERRLASAESAARRKLLADPANAEKAAAVSAYESAMNVAALAVGDIHRDFYRLPVNRIPSETADVATLKKQYAALKDSLKSGGTLTWIVKPRTENIAGWPYRGFTVTYQFGLSGGEKNNLLWQVGTWELGGDAVGNTLVALRYRGLGQLEQPIAAGEGGGADAAFSTSDIIPGNAGGPMAISPVVPASSQVNDRGYAIKHRIGAWIYAPARGAGSPLMDFQFHDNAILMAYPERQGNLRSNTELLPGDGVISQTDMQYFALTGEHTTIPMHYLALTSEEKVAVESMRTRWKEADQHVRDHVSKELGFVQREVRPGVGLLYDNGWAGHFKGLAGGYGDRLAAAGVKTVAIHNPGWINGRYQGPDGPPKTGGGVCDIYDWWPTTDVEEPWRAMTKNFAKHDIAYYPWLGQTVWRDAPFVERLGLDKKLWSLNGPKDAHGPGYGATAMKGNIYNNTFRDAFTGRLDEVFKKFGYQGFWADSFQNLFMSQLNWAEGTGDSMQRGWWELIAKWSQNGIDWMGESHSVPGLSCSIENHGWEEFPWYYQHVFKWLRGNSQAKYKPDELHDLVFRVAANKGWVAVDLSYNRPLDKTMPGFADIAKPYMAALPMMRRPYILSGDRGVLWLPFDSSKQGVWWSFNDAALPAKVAAKAINADGTKSAVDAAAKHRVLHVAGADLLEAFGVAKPPLADPREKFEYDPQPYAYPDWAKE